MGPLSDFSQLVGFEDAAGGIGAMSEISVKRFKQGRATLAMRFKQPVELLRELEERAPFVFTGPGQALGPAGPGRRRVAASPTGPAGAGCV